MTYADEPKWKHVKLRRYLIWLERSIDAAVSWAVFEPNGPRLWARVQDQIADFLAAEWRGGKLLGDAPADAFFVRCDATTMTQDDIDNGRLICEVGVAVVAPAQLVIFRIGQWTGC